MSESVSVIIPVYNGERFLAEAIQSVLDQTLPPDEIIVVDDGSTDGTAQVVAGLTATAAMPIRYLYQENRGPAAARNHGLRLSNSDFVAFQDADDIWTERKLETQIGILQRSPGKSIAMGKSQYVQVSQSGELIPCSEPYDKAGHLIMFQCALFRRSILDSVGLLDEALRLGEDSDWYFRALEYGAEIAMHDELVVLYRRHEGNLTNDLRATRSHLFLALKMSLARRRQNVTATNRASQFAQIIEALRDR
jgi:glycosyltransferase involved in cell wall biosynthesis